MAIGEEITARDVYALRDATGVGLMEAKRALMRNSALLAVKAFRETGDRETLADILEYLVKEKQG